MQTFFDKYIRLIVVGLVLVVASAVIWWQAVYQSPARAFNDMLVNNLTTSAVTKTKTTKADDVTFTQHIALQLGETSASRWLVTIKQGKGEVTTESIGTKDSGYVRYTAYAGPAGTAAPKNVVGVWAKAKAGDKDSTLSKLFSDSLLDIASAPVPPVGNVNADSRRDMLAYIKEQQVFTPDYKKVTSGVVNGRKVYNYPVDVKLSPYVRLMQVFSHVYGLTDIDQIDANAYQATAAVRITVSVDKLSHRMVKVTYDASNFSQTFHDYGVARTITAPTKTISEAELQKRLGDVR